MFRSLITHLTGTDRQKNHDETVRIRKLRLWDFVGAAIGGLVACGFMFWLASLVLR